MLRCCPVYLNLLMANQFVRRQKSKALSCETCGKVFQVRKNLSVHMRIHSGEKPFSCETCGKNFNQLCSLKRHTRLHTGDRPYPCTTCGKSFKESSKLKLHIMIHTGEKPCSCDKCGSKFRTSGDLRKHLMIHTGEKPFVCPTCGKCFNRKSDMKRHCRVHSGQNAENYQRQLKRRQELSNFKDLSFTYVICVPPFIEASSQGLELSSELKSRDKIDLIPAADVEIKNESAGCIDSDYFHGTFGSCAVTIHAISISKTSISSIQSQRFLHPNIVMTFGITLLHDHQLALVMESLVTSLERLTAEVGTQLTLRERVDLSLGCVSAIDYLHHQLGVFHGFLTCSNIFCTSLLTAKVLDPVAAKLITGDDVTSYVAMNSDLVQVGHVLLKLFGVLSKTDSRTIGSGEFGIQPSLYSIMENLIMEKMGSLSTAGDMVSVLISMRETDQYRQCPLKRMYRVLSSSLASCDEQTV